MPIIIILILLLREFFWLLPADLVVLPDIVRLSDIGILLILLVVIYAIVTNFDKIKCLNSSFTPVIIGFMVLSLFNVYLSNLYYEQPIALGVRAIRTNLFYLLFFVVILVIDTREKLNRLVKWLVVLCLILVGFTVMQYAMPGASIFHTENEGIFEKRFGLVRLINPGLDLIALACFIVIARFIQSGVPCRLSCMMNGAIFTLQILFSQTRAYLLSFPLAMMVSLTKTGKFRWLIVVVWCSVIGVGVLQMSEMLTGQKHENFITRLLESSVTETMSQKGNVGIRFQTAREFWKYGIAHPITGSGVINAKGKVAQKLNYPVLRTDLGYVIMFSQYGLLGIAWLVWLSAVYFRKVKLFFRKTADPELKSLVFALLTHYIFVVISFVTLPHFILGSMIVTVVLNVGILEVVHRFADEPEQQEGPLYAWA